MASEEATFRAYTQAQGASYATGRPGYSPALFKFIIDHHTSTGGQLDTVVDVGCGTGQATQHLAPYFAHAIGLDPSEGMISTARTAAQQPGDPPIRFEVSAAEALGADLAPAVADGSVDLVTAATAAHWFDMPRFWAAAARALRPGGTVALWARAAFAVDAARTPNGAAVKAAIDDLLLKELALHTTRGNELVRELYVDLPLPWTLEAPVVEFDRESFFRKEWNKNREGIDIDNLGTGRTVTLKQFESIMSTASPVTRWREAHPDKVGTEEDVLVKARRRIESLLHEVGVKPGEELVTAGVAIVLLMVKKRR